MPRQKDAATELAERMLQILQAQRLQGPTSYPLTLKRVAELTDPAAPPAQVDRAAAKKSFTDRVLLARKKTPDAPLALAEDLDLLAASPLLLEFVLEGVCTPASPTCPLGKLKARVVTSLKKPFEEAVKRQVLENALPPAVGYLTVKKTTHLYLRRLPPPPPPKPPAVDLAEKLVRLLEAKRGQGPDAYPLPVCRLVQLTAPDAPPALVKKAVAQEPFRSQALVARANDPRAPVALADDRDRLADSPLLLEYLLEASRTAASHAFGLTDWKKKVAPILWPPFQDAVQRRIEEGTLPSSVGWLLIKGRNYLFLHKDLSGGRPVPAAVVPVPPRSPMVEPPRPAEPPLDFAQAFEEAFDRLDRQQQTHNRVSLLDLRRALPVSRAAFDAGLHALRQARRFSLSATEGRHPLRPEEQEAGVTEDGALLLYVSRRKTP